MTEAMQKQFQDGLALFDQGRVREAVNKLETCLKADPENPHYALNLGHALSAAGDSDHASRLYRELMTSPDRGIVYAACWSLADLKGYRFTEPELSQMQEMADSGEPHAQRFLLMHALGQAHEKNGGFEPAFIAYSQANEQLAEERPYPATAWRQLADSILSIRDVPRHSGSNVNTPIFIVGMPRSGSTLLEQIIGTHRAAQAAGELPFIENLARSLDQQGGFANALPRLESRHCSAGAAAYLEQVHTLLNGKPSKFVDKWPDNFWYIGLIRSLFPAAPIINIMRDPLDNALAVYKQFFSRGNEFSSRLDWTAHYWDCYLDVMHHWNALFPGEVMNLRYRDLVLEPETTVREVLAHCDLDFEPEVLEFHKNRGAVMTPSGQQVRQPIYASALDSARPFRPYIEEFIPRFEGIAARAEDLL